ncbi:Hypothetical protein RG1141_CH01330 [Neorhizobium galegae bv. officinalis bv. officinalis str. HAMBI 1141]|uniref:Uncharacterized protein n=1 Tax=Neorhizobium galegae bv. officinalis bv. officinalis str. HAMBI 1141 TaxID=1028801 RepID=A0A068T284_NEOGA|nr:hypothetical protein [Neorhizobium galegae]CDN52498.1 Hypothetical protein RG1141_CH01330 [Neorhizobium galegae bv. officinalis bv. officinalis str. HAMBI 1141]
MKTLRFLTLHRYNVIDLLTAIMVATYLADRAFLAALVWFAVSFPLNVVFATIVRLRDKKKIQEDAL